MQKSPSKIRRIIQEAAANTTGEVLPRGDTRYQPERIRSQTERATANGVSIRTQAKLDYLAGHAPELLEKVKCGQVSVDRAYKQARGIRRKLTPLERVQRLWAKASPEERLTIARWVFEAHHQEFRKGGQ
ncbi:MAG: hypothetical protein FOGNACKC_05467 [Anaerolineae bacterium]|nr:hypothetical protein [Anaerolineae bacterium]